MIATELCGIIIRWKAELRMSTYKGHRNAKRRASGRNTAVGREKGKSRRKAAAFPGNTYIKWGTMILAVLTLVLAVRGFAVHGSKYVSVDASEPDIDVQLLDINPYSRPGTETEEITGIVVHYTANPGSTAQNNRDYFNGLKDSHETEASSNFIVGLDGEIIQCVPTWEMAYASNSRNIDTVSIECCHPDETGKFTDETYRSLVQLTAWLCVKFNLTQDQVIRHYDVTGKNCPKYFVENKEAWDQFKQDVAGAIAKGS